MQATRRYSDISYEGLGHLRIWTPPWIQRDNCSSGSINAYCLAAEMTVEVEAGSP